MKLKFIQSVLVVKKKKTVTSIGYIYLLHMKIKSTVTGGVIKILHKFIE